MIVKTPGVYIKETNNFPPSIVEESTAVPVFIGFTAIVPVATTAPFAPVNDVLITNMLDFIEAFGNKYPVEYTVEVNTAEVITPDRNFYLYDSLDLYFRNGGGPCYVISAGAFMPAPASFQTAIEEAIAKIDKVGGATIIVVPDLHIKSDGVEVFSESDYGSMASEILNVCGEEQDKFALFDYHTPATSTIDMRSELSPLSGNLKYGALYYPWLKNGKNFPVAYENLASAPASTIPTTTATGSAVLTESIDEINDELGHLENKLSLNEISISALNEKYDGLLTAYADAAAAGKRGALTNIFMFLHNLIAQLEEVESQVNANSPFLASIAQLKDTPSFIAEIQKLIRFVHLLKTLNPGALSTLYVDDAVTNWVEPSDNNWINISPATHTYAAVEALINFIKDVDFEDTGVTGTPNKSRDQILSEFNAGLFVDFQLIFASIASLADGLNQRKSQLERRLFSEDPMYITIQNAVNACMKQIPSQGAIAGIYCANDRSRGVWKSPANMAVQGIEKPLVEVSNREQDGLNVDPLTGKSINVIRTFTGKGPLVWGARTLAGNDNEWRYISVRRFFNFAEESIGKSLQAFVFEPNTVLTWVKIKAMITSFLVNQWQAGALTGATLNEAFFVKVDEETTSPADIANGIVNIQIGLAVARPAEFIILEFSHHLKA